MGCRAYVAAKYDVTWQTWIGWEEFDKLINAWEDLYELYGPGEWSYATDDYNNWYEFEKNQLQDLLKILDTFVEKDGKIYPPEVDTAGDEAADTWIKVNVRDRLREILDIAKNMDYVRVEFD